MNRQTLSLSISTILIAFSAIVMFSGCKQMDQSASCCQGFTGQVGKNGNQLLHRDHFITKDTIIAWVNRWNTNKKLFTQSLMVDSVGIVGVSHSFNKFIIRAIICNDSSIGLRVLTGQSADLKVHTILVGIAPDYTNLYIPNGDYFEQSGKTSQLMEFEHPARNLLGNSAPVSMGLGSTHSNSDNANPVKNYGGAETSLDP